MNPRTWARVLIAILFSISGLVETLSATGLVVELSPDGRWGPGVRTLAVSGPVQIVGAVLLASGRKTRWALSILGCYVFLVSVFGNLPLIFNPDVGKSAIAGLLSNVAVMGGILYWLHSERIPGAHKAKPAGFDDKSCAGCAGQPPGLPSFLRPTDTCTGTNDPSHCCATPPIKPDESGDQGQFLHSVRH